MASRNALSSVKLARAGDGELGHGRPGVLPDAGAVPALAARPVGGSASQTAVRSRYTGHRWIQPSPSLHRSSLRPACLPACPAASADTPGSAAGRPPLLAAARVRVAGPATACSTAGTDSDPRRPRDRPASKGRPCCSRPPRSCPLGPACAAPCPSPGRTAGHRPARPETPVGLNGSPSGSSSARLTFT
jgi:hypothetical protein